MFVLKKSEIIHIFLKKLLNIKNYIIYFKNIFKREKFAPSLLIGIKWN